MHTVLGIYYIYIDLSIYLITTLIHQIIEYKHNLYIFMYFCNFTIASVQYINRAHTLIDF